MSDEEKPLSPYAPIHISVLIHLARDIVKNARENGWTEANAETAMRNLWYMAAKNGPIDNPQQAYDKVMAEHAGQDPTTVKH